MKTRLFDDGFPVGSGFSKIYTHGGILENYDEGIVFTRHGIVQVYAQGCKNFSHNSRLDFVKNGRVYSRHFKNKRLSHRGLSMMAKRFAKEISESK